MNILSLFNDFPIESIYEKKLNSLVKHRLDEWRISLNSRVFELNKNSKNNKSAGLDVSKELERYFSEFFKIVWTYHFEQDPQRLKIKKLSKGADFNVYVDDKLYMIIECKSHMDKTTLAKSLQDCTVAKYKNPDVQFFVIQAESDLAGNYHSVLEGSPDIKTINKMRLFTDIDACNDVKILTLMDKHRDSKKVFYREGTRKEFPMYRVEYAGACLIDAFVKSGCLFVGK